MDGANRSKNDLNNGTTRQGQGSDASEPWPPLSSGTRANFAAGSLGSLRRRERSEAFERDARVGEGAADQRPVQKAQWSDADGKLNE